jgi:phosphatidylinositol-3-phosphatase
MPNLPSLRAFRYLRLSLSSMLIVLVSMVTSSLLAVPAVLAINGVPTPAHIVVVMEENHSYNEIIGSSSAPYINSLANSGALFTQSFAITHPSEPNYLAIFSGSTQGITDDSCPHTFGPPDLGGELIAASKTFAGYSESMPSVGYTGCTYPKGGHALYFRKHNPWVNFTDVPSGDNLPFTSFPSGNFSALPTISFVVPNINNDMHNGTIQQGDSWLQTNIDPYVQWAKTNNSLLIVTWDEDDGSQNNQIPTIFVGPMVKVGHYAETINHYNILRTLEDAYGLPYANNSSTATPITDCWI